MFETKQARKPTLAIEASQRTAQGPAQQRVSPELNLPRALGNQAYGQYLQAKLTVGAPDDPSRLGTWARSLLRAPETKPADAAERSADRAAAAAEILSWRHQVISDLTHKGVLALDVLPEQMTAELINKYLEVKARHLL